MGFRDARTRAIEALCCNAIQHEARDEIDEKNLLGVGAITPQEVIRLLNACRGADYSCSPHHSAPEIDVHVFRPIAALAAGGPRSAWYIKLYFVEPDVVFISVHRSSTARLL